MCVMNCPYGVLKPDDATKSVVIKCDFCKDLGGEPSCVKASSEAGNSRRGGITYEICDNRNRRSRYDCSQNSS